MGIERAKKRMYGKTLAISQIDNARKRPKLEPELGIKTHPMLTRSSCSSTPMSQEYALSTETTKQSTEWHTGLDRRNLGFNAPEGSSDDSSDDEGSQEDHRCKEVRLLTEEIVNRVNRTKDTKKPAVSDECITSITIVARLLANKLDTKMVIYVAGAIESVENCTKLACEDQVVISVKTIWIYNKEFRAKIEQLWRKSTLEGFLPHVAFMVDDKLEQMNLANDDSFSIVFRSQNIEFIHKSLIVGSESTKKYCWEILTKAKGIQESVAKSETRNPKMFSMQGSLVDFEEEAIACSKASFFLDKNRTSISRDNNRTPRRMQSGNGSMTKIVQDGACSEIDVQPSIIATMSFTRIREDSRKAIILSVGSQSKFVTAKPTGAEAMVMDAKKLVFEFRQNYGMNKNYIWGIATCELDGTREELECLAAYIRSQWEIPSERKEVLSKNNLTGIEEQLTDIACHTLYLDTGTERYFVPHNFESATARKFEKLKKRRKTGDCHIECYSHVAREKALHDFFYENTTYRSDWETGIDFRHFYNKHYSTLSNHNIDCVSFKYPTVRFGFQKHRDEHAIFFQNSFEGTKHHKFVSDFRHEPKRFDHQTFEKMLLCEWTKRA